MQKVVIGIMPLWDDEKKSLWMLPEYMSSLEDFGAVTIMLPLTTNETILDYFISLCDGFLLTGGQDVSPLLYHEQPSPQCGVSCDMRDAMDSYILIKSIEQNKAVLGICRGIQLMNVVLGGTLYQDLPTENGSNIDHHMSAPYDREAHKLHIINHTPLRTLLGKELISVNSYHHQAVKILAKPLSAMAYAEDKIIEAAYMPSRKFIWGIQWHPEFSYKVSEKSKAIFRAFLLAAKEQKK